MEVAEVEVALTMVRLVMVEVALLTSSDPVCVQLPVTVSFWPTRVMPDVL